VNWSRVVARFISVSSKVSVVQGPLGLPAVPQHVQGAVLLRPGLVVEGIESDDHVRSIASGFDVDRGQVLMRLAARHEVDRRRIGEAAQSTPWPAERSTARAMEANSASPMAWSSTDRLPCPLPGSASA
jgi:hypothetical protein